jgi:acyl-ACP thioesterase
VRTPSGAALEVATLWVHVDGAGRPARLPAWFLRTYGEAAGGRTVSSRRRLGAPPPDAPGYPWQVRVADLDVLGHVNNAVLWAPVEEELARRSLSPTSVELEFVAPVLAGDQVQVVSSPASGQHFSMWQTVGGEVRVPAAVIGAAVTGEAVRG